MFKISASGAAQLIEWQTASKDTAVVTSYAMTERYPQLIIWVRAGDGPLLYEFKGGKLTFELEPKG